MTSSELHRFESAPRLARTLQQTTGSRIDAQTVRNRLHAVGLQARRPVGGVPLTARHIQERLRWGRIHQHWPCRQWDQTNPGFVFSLRMVGVAYGGDGENDVIHTTSFSMTDMAVTALWSQVWAGIHGGGKTDLVLIHGNMTDQR